jgi:hypothetical protein
MKYSKHILLSLFAIITGVSMFQNYYNYASFYSACHPQVIGLLGVGPFGQTIPLSCNDSMLYLAFNTVWIWWIVALIVGAAGLTATSLWMWQHRVMEKDVTVVNRELGQLTK